MTTEANSQPMHIVFLADEWGSAKGGVSTINRELAKQFAKLPNAAIKVSFLVPPREGTDDAKKKAAECGINLVVAGQDYAGFDDHTSLCFPPDNLEGIDVVVGHGRKLGPPAHPIRASTQCKWVQFVHVSSEEIGMSKGIGEYQPKHKIELELCRNADLVVAVGPNLAHVYSTQLLYPQPKNVHTFIPGIFEEFRELSPAEYDKTPFRILMFGRGREEEFDIKGYDIAAKAIASMSRTYLLNFVGAPEGEEENVKENFLQHGISKNQLRVRTYCLNREDLSKMFMEADLAIMPSRTEGFGLAGLEAMSAGVPILVTANSGFAEVLKGVPHGSSCVVDSEDPQYWKKKIEVVLFETQRTVRIAAAAGIRDAYAKMYSWEEECTKIVDEILRI